MLGLLAPNATCAWLFATDVQGGIMHRKLVSLIIAADAVTIVVAYMQFGQAGAESRFGNRFTVIESGTQAVFQDEATHASPEFTKPIPPGDSLAFKADPAPRPHDRRGRTG
jgi:hypothetical protein